MTINVRKILRSGCVLLAFGAAMSSHLGGGPRAASAATTCDRYVATAGDDGNDGSAATPFRSLGRLAAQLSAGQTGCLVGGKRYDAVAGNGIVGSSNGTATAPITIRSGPGGRASVYGWVWVKPAAHDVVMTDLNFVGSALDAGGNPIEPKSTHIHIDGPRTKLVGNDITDPYGICIDAGTITAYSQNYSGNRADDLVIDDNRVHGCGMSAKVNWTAADSGAHGIYLVNTLNARVTNNLVYANRYRGLQTWPKADGSLIANNLFDGNATHVNIGSALPDGYPWYSSNTTVRDNIMSNRVTNWWPDRNPAQVYGNYPNGSPTYGNQVFGNCMPSNDVQVAGNGLSVGANIVGQAQYLNRAAGDYRLAAGSPCAGKGPKSVQPLGPPSLDAARTDNYKACWNADPTVPELRTFLSLKSVTVGGVVFHHAMTLPAGQSIDYRADSDGIALKGSDNSAAWLTAATTSANVGGEWIRFDGNGDFGVMTSMKSRDALKTASISLTMTVSRTKGGAVLGTASPSYRYDSVAATAPRSTNCDANLYSREWNGPGGRWYTASGFSYFDWDSAHAYPPASSTPPDTTAPTLQSVTMPTTTTARTITIGISATDNVKVTEVRFANEDGVWSAWQPFATSKQWTLSGSAAAYKGVSTQVRDAAQNESASLYQRITCNAPCS